MNAGGDFGHESCDAVGERRRFVNARLETDAQHVAHDLLAAPIDGELSLQLGVLGQRRPKIDRWYQTKKKKKKKEQVSLSCLPLEFFAFRFGVAERVQGANKLGDEYCVILFR